MYLGVTETIVLLEFADRRSRELQADAGVGGVCQPPSPPQGRRWAWLGTVGRVVARRRASPTPEPGAAAGGALASAHSGLRG